MGFDWFVDNLIRCLSRMRWRCKLRGSSPHSCCNDESGVDVRAFVHILRDTYWMWSSFLREAGLAEWKSSLP